MIDSRTAPYGALLLRVTLGVMFLAHSLYLKVVVFTVPGTVKFFQSLGLPALAAYGTIAVEAIAGVLLVLGVRSRWAALATLPVLFGATWVHAHNGWVFNANGGGWEYPVFLAVAAVVQSLLGDGAWALSRVHPFAAAARNLRTAAPRLTRESP